RPPAPLGVQPAPGRAMSAPLGTLTALRGVPAIHRAPFSRASIGQQVREREGTRRDPREVRHSAGGLLSTTTEGVGIGGPPSPSAPPIARCASGSQVTEVTVAPARGRCQPSWLTNFR